MTKVHFLAVSAHLAYKGYIRAYDSHNLKKIYSVKTLGKNLFSKVRALKIKIINLVGYALVFTRMALPIQFLGEWSHNNLSKVRFNVHVMGSRASSVGQKLADPYCFKLKNVVNVYQPSDQTKMGMP